MNVMRTVARKTRPLRRVLTPRQFKETYINEFLKHRADATYIEIGVQAGESFREVSAVRKVGVDLLRNPAMSQLAPGEEFFEQASDEFFATAQSSVLSPEGIDVALVDGLHEFRQALRDVLNLERFMRPDGLIVIDDCNPCTLARAIDSRQPGTWNGDVWKVIAFLRSERPDLRTITVDADQGIGLVTGFHGGASRPTDAMLRRYKDLDYEELGRDRRTLLGLVAPASISRLLNTGE